ncbi:RagB/SusD family nutrient uptake outer membrane protein [Aquimarina sp. U1-2]|uniref:RagB/SusD family nutrient uptake outer membrane protein n=1 Tax=Aquimarina sp. U1-2 TaxID=2823141 RepID=UPI001AEC7DEE|nr:RagB/SusD family nutrient uptake outer membrane protein [Aquimarina sp. U1-2]MBP2830654.1 RagB/SusD family nutrient uptake outer membrane protein [Aquimarina sp. U1-2]
MRKFLKIIVISTFLVGCNDFLDEEPVQFRTPVDFFQNENEIDQGLAAVYNSNRALYNGGGFQLRFGESRSDNTNIEIVNNSALANREIDEFSMNSTNANISEYWNRLYQGIARANFILASVDNAVFNDENTKDARKGETLFLRTLFYFHLTRIFGDVPFIIRPGETPDQILSDEFLERDTQEEIYTAIFDHIQEAIDLLPNTTDDPGRATRGAALMLKAKMHMAQSPPQYEAARPLLEEITRLGYSLLPNYEDVFFTRNHNEGIFEIQYSPSLLQGADFFSAYVPSVSEQEILGEGINPNPNGNQYQPTQDLIDLYSDDDQRRAHNIRIYIDDTGVAYPWAGKFAKPFVTQDNLNQQDINWQMYRYADALLMLAECYEKVGGGDPLTILATIRQRAGLSPQLSPQELANLEQTIADERRRELVFEGHRYFDLLRTGKLVEVMTAHGAQQVADGLTLTGNAYQNIRTIIGIPDNQVIEFGMQQTPGWE